MVQNNGWNTGGDARGDGARDPSSAHDDPARWGPRLARILSRQCELCRELDGLSAGQSEMIAGGDTDGLLRLLAQRQKLVDELTALSEETEPFRRRWDWYMHRLAGADRQRLDERVTEMGALVERIARRDDADRTALEHLRSAVASEISGLDRGRGAIAAYSQKPAISGARFQDRTG